MLTSGHIIPWTSGQGVESWMFACIMNCPGTCTTAGTVATCPAFLILWIQRLCALFPREEGGQWFSVKGCGEYTFQFRQTST